MAILKFKATLKEMIWGGEILKEKRGKFLKSQEEIPSGPVGESWEIAHEQFSLMLKIINAEKDLSIQVHPRDDLEHNIKGKEEAWIVLDATQEARLYLGLKEGVSLQELKELIEKKESDEIKNLLNVHIPKPGDVYHIRPGVIHAIGAGVTVAEIQQYSHITYRLFDWNRLGLDGKPRELHLKEAFQVLDMSQKSQQCLCLPDLQNLQGLQVLNYIKNEDQDHFSLMKIIPRGGAIPQIDLSPLCLEGSSFMILFLMQGVARLGSHLLTQWDSILITKDSILRGEAKLECYGADVQCLVFQDLKN